MKKHCSIDDCERPYYLKGYCMYHYWHIVRKHRRNKEDGTQYPRGWFPGCPISGFVGCAKREFVVPPKEKRDSWIKHYYTNEKKTLAHVALLVGVAPITAYERLIAMGFNPLLRTCLKQGCQGQPRVEYLGLCTKHYLADAPMPMIPPDTEIRVKESYFMRRKHG